jgi:polyvinyl alcohol dehydrogenase (cytochrome)
LHNYSTTGLRVFTGSLFIITMLTAQNRLPVMRANANLWESAGGGLPNDRNQPAETILTPANVNSLKPLWTFTTGGDVSATPTVDATAVYVPDWAGNLFAVSRSSGQMIWSHKISEYDGFSGAISRVSPAISGSDLIIGDIESPSLDHEGANVIAVSRTTGALRWITNVESHPAAIITGSPVVYENVIYVGVSSIEEGLADDPGYACCTFRGSVVALDALSGEILWKRYVVPDNGGAPGGYSGGAVWQPAAIDPVRRLLFIGTGNNYSAPENIKACEAQSVADNNQSPDCTPTRNYFDTALALHLKTGEVAWAKRLKAYDVWTVACIAPKAGVVCPSPAGPDYDLGGSGPNLMSNLVGFGQKSGIYWALNPDTGDIVWTSVVGPGGVLGGIEWGTASDGLRIYAAISNEGRIPYSLSPGGGIITFGSWAALDAITGKILWQTADPAGAIDPGAVSVANGVVYAGSFSGTMYALNALSGAILWSFPSGGSVVDGPSISSGTVYWGSGYKHISPGVGNNKLFAFRLSQ